MSHAVLDEGESHMEHRRAITPVAAALLEEGHAALERTLDDGLRGRIQDVQVVLKFAMDAGREVTEREAASVRRTFAQTVDLASCGNCSHSIDVHRHHFGCTHFLPLRPCECRAFVLRMP